MFFEYQVVEHRFATKKVMERIVNEMEKTRKAKERRTTHEKSRDKLR